MNGKYALDLSLGMNFCFRLSRKLNSKFLWFRNTVLNLWTLIDVGITSRFNFRYLSWSDTQPYLYFEVPSAINSFVKDCPTIERILFPGYTTPADESVNLIARTYPGQEALDLSYAGSVTLFRNRSNLIFSYHPKGSRSSLIIVRISQTLFSSTQVSSQASLIDFVLLIRRTRRRCNFEEFNYVNVSVCGFSRKKHARDRVFLSM